MVCPLRVVGSKSTTCATPLPRRHARRRLSVASEVAPPAQVGRKRLFVEAPFAASDWADVPKPRRRAIERPGSSLRLDQLREGDIVCRQVCRQEWGGET